ncbi:MULTISPECIES: GNAT family N-acetyltransferase [unclassified Tolypothrix]|uniref:GNAT family N-acetyltransferase n=1 Tax=unclassified Tolypothrix TaxID=2649714 RepID=UPI0005EAC274|nr:MULTISPECIES: GNAT family N-acetyltransferase [unclassified Tolypothrix]BAY94922.1 GCN5-related N-acetyltransferase [Microchaete diplosiphon NIES-3275]EKF00972.1 acetyltransferase, GNAT family [Tolypothrix sp. PCC 7601]MBE9082452.1 GNAT family N-acetyltransferase [Tolypothrix sp. LEGE 11397]UYD28562.1 GNAT family N-acetyltransferase [Tolypothrix sp. PCC 7712]UYD35527.1 GNAT family N-acetyltransferase [Tolypothrix sp. PCC 7601]
MINKDLIIKIVESPEEFAAIKAIRIAVFQEEQGVEAALEFDGKDEICDHLIAYLNQEAVGTTRIRYLDNKIAKIERLAVLSKARGKGIGKQLMEKAIEIIAHQHIPEVIVHAQKYIQGLYDNLGFIPEGEVFMEADIAHIKMKRKLL